MAIGQLICGLLVRKFRLQDFFRLPMKSVDYQFIRSERGSLKVTFVWIAKLGGIMMRNKHFLLFRRWATLTLKHQIVEQLPSVVRKLS